MSEADHHTEPRRAVVVPAVTSSPSTDREICETLLENSPVRIERIISTGQQSPPDFWYDQDWDEWVTVISGTAVLTVQHNDDRCETHSLGPGDSVYLPAHVRHRVERTDRDPPTIWLAVHIKNGT
ncbi:MAG: cupin domain-containing protein [Planctomycetes bacterium]|nr:cupin domain-containing protein [Planctomycetota bacterium]NOG53890.1 cupin domain-containing protein [Planctomycetota bacterium]